MTCRLRNSLTIDDALRAQNGRLVSIECGDLERDQNRSGGCENATCQDVVLEMAELPEGRKVGLYQSP